ncbi:TPA: VirB3 family type IV secretion system protein [Burkholderia cepacia]
MDKDEELIESTVIRSAQRPALMFYVPLSLFLAETLLILALFRFLGFWVLVFVPLHFWFVSETLRDFNWMKVLWINLMHFWLFVRNRGFYGKHVVTFTPAPVNARNNDYDSLR